MNTIKLIDQIRASQALYAAELARYDELTDYELARVLGLSSDSTIARVLDAASDSSTIARVLGLSSDSTIARVLDAASDSTIACVLGAASDSTIARVLDLSSDSTIARVLGLSSDSTIARVLDAASDSTIARLNVAVPIVEDLDRRVYEAVNGGVLLNMDRWHCGTTHCRGGWEITLAGDAGKALEKVVGSEVAARLIHEASTGRVAPNYYASDADALADIKRCAGVA